MASWFSFDTITDLKKKVQSALPVDDNLLTRLTLQSPDLAAERQKIDSEERRKEAVRNCVSALLPWETHDDERKALVDKCKEAILSLSLTESSFILPYKLPDGKRIFLNSNENVEDGELQANEAQAVAAAIKVSDLEPLPLLLADFDLDAHVGLIQRMLKEDKHLVDIHSQLTGAGDKEKTFWRNYFFHCAYTRYSHGLSIDEIWGDKPKPADAEESASSTGEILPRKSGAGADDDESAEGSSITPSSNKGDGSSVSSIASASQLPIVVHGSTVPLSFLETAVATSSAVSSHSGGSGSSLKFNSSTSVGGNDYEVVDAAVQDDLDEDDLDDLEAEIARELEN